MCHTQPLHTWVLSFLLHPPGPGAAGSGPSATLSPRARSLVDGPACFPRRWPGPCYFGARGSALIQPVCCDAVPGCPQRRPRPPTIPGTGVTQTQLNPSGSVGTGTRSGAGVPCLPDTGSGLGLRPAVPRLGLGWPLLPGTWSHAGLQTLQLLVRVPAGGSRRLGHCPALADHSGPSLPRHAEQVPWLGCSEGPVTGSPSLLLFSLRVLVSFSSVKGLFSPLWPLLTPLRGHLVAHGCPQGLRPEPLPPVASLPRGAWSLQLCDRLLTHFLLAAAGFQAALRDTATRKGRRPVAR